MAMHDETQVGDKLLADLQKRAKELNCLYEVEEALARVDWSLDDCFQKIVDVIPPGWRYPDDCEAELEYFGQIWQSNPFEKTPWVVRADLKVQHSAVGALRVYYTKHKPLGTDGPFLKEEKRLVKTIAERLSHHIFYQQIKGVRQGLEQVSIEVEAHQLCEWRAPLNLLRRTDKDLYQRIARKMLYHLFQTGIEEAAGLLHQGWSNSKDPDIVMGEVNSPAILTEQDDSWLLSDEPFELAGRHINSQEILSRVQRWMVEDRASRYTKVLHNPRSSLQATAEALQRFHHVVEDVADLPQHTISGLRVALIRKLLTEQLDFITVAKEYISTRAFQRIFERVVMPVDGHGKLGGKAAGLVLALCAVRKSKTISEEFKVKIPKTWFVASSAHSRFIAYNDLEDVLEQKYKPIDVVNQEYPNLIRLFKRSQFSPDLLKGFSMVLDEFTDRPLVVRSSSLLEDRVGTTFSGKYKSLFVANQGTKQERLAALLDAISEVYASTYGPDPIAYRREHGLLDFDEEMGILIQEVVGQRVGRYFLPAFAGVAFSNNEFRWSPRIRRDDGLIRMVPGLGSRAVDRLADDYPVLAVPGQPTLRVNTGTEEVVRYAPRWIDVIDLEQRCFRTLAIDELLRDCGSEYPAFEQVFSKLDDGLLRKPVALLTDPEQDTLIATCEGVISSSPFVERMDKLLHVLSETLGKPVDVEFAHDGEHLYVVQCRAQSSSDDSAPAPIPHDVDPRDVLFSAHRHISNGSIPDLTHVVYVDPAAYSAVSDIQDLKEIGSVVGRLNKRLPRRQFALLGPGRWGSRGDVKLGVSVTYSDINNTALLVEIARQSGSYVPDLSFGTHFFQDLVEARIRYLPLYPDEEDSIFREQFFLDSPNMLAEMLPQYAHFADVVKVVDIPAVADGRLLRVLMNAELNEAMALLVSAD